MEAPLWKRTQTFFILNEHIRNSSDTTEVQHIFSRLVYTLQTRHQLQSFETALTTHIRTLTTLKITTTATATTAHKSSKHNTMHATALNNKRVFSIDSDDNEAETDTETDPRPTRTHSTMGTCNAQTQMQHDNKEKEREKEKEKKHNNDDTTPWKLGGHTQAVIMQDALFERIKEYLNPRDIDMCTCTCKWMCLKLGDFESCVSMICPRVYVYTFTAP